MTMSWPRWNLRKLFCQDCVEIDFASDRVIDALSFVSHRDKGNRRGAFSGLHIIMFKNISVCVYSTVRIWSNEACVWASGADPTVCDMLWSIKAPQQDKHADDQTGHTTVGFLCAPQCLAQWHVNIWLCLLRHSRPHYSVPYSFQFKSFNW